MKKCTLITILVSSIFAHAASIADLNVKSNGRSSGNLVKIKKSSAVPSFEIHNAKGGVIPKLDIGEEAEVEFQVVQQQ